MGYVPPLHTSPISGDADPLPLSSPYFLTVRPFVGYSDYFTSSAVRFTFASLSVFNQCKGLYPAVCFRGEYETVRGPSSGRRPRVAGKSLGRGGPSPSGMGVRGVIPGKILILRYNLVKSGAFWQEIDGSLVFHLFERKHCHNVRQWY